MLSGAAPLMFFSQPSRGRRHILWSERLAENESRITPGIVVIYPLLSLSFSPVPRSPSWVISMVDKGPLLTSAIIFYLSIGAAIFQVLEEPNWVRAANEYSTQKDTILKKHPCLTQDDLDYILEVWSSSLTVVYLNWISLTTHDVNHFNCYWHF